MIFFLLRNFSRSRGFSFLPIFSYPVDSLNTPKHVSGDHQASRVRVHTVRTVFFFEQQQNPRYYTLLLLFFFFIQYIKYACTRWRRHSVRADSRLQRIFKPKVA